MNDYYYLSNVAFVAWVSGVITEAYCVNKLFWYSCNDDGGERNFDMAQESKKFAFDAHSDKSFDNLSFSSSLAPKIKHYQINVANHNLK